MELEFFPTDFQTKYANNKFHENPSSVSHADGKTERESERTR